MQQTLYKTLSTFFILFAVYAASAQTQKFDDIAEALQKGNAPALANFFEGNVEITILSGGTSYSKNQAEIVLKDFFTKNPPKSFALMHQGNSPGGVRYFIGDLVTASHTYNTYVLVKTINKNQVIQEIRFSEK